MKWFEILIIVVAVAIVAGAILSAVLKKRRGKNSCGCSDCSACCGCAGCCKNKSHKTDICTTDKK